MAKLALGADRLNIWARCADRVRRAGVATSAALALLALAACRPSNDGALPSAPPTTAPPPTAVTPPSSPIPRDPIAPRERPNRRSAIGYNLDYPGDWTRMPPFIDYMKNARIWRGMCDDARTECDPAAHLDLDASGWVKSTRFRDIPDVSYARVEAVVVTNEDASAVGRKFIVDWQGEGDIELFNAKVEDKGERRIAFSLQQGPMYLRILASDPKRNGNYVRQIRVYRADQAQLLAQGHTFNPEMLDYLAPFGSLRFMDWMESNKSGVCMGGTRADQDCYTNGEECGGGGRCVMAGAWAERPRADQVSYLARSQYFDTARPELGSRVGGYPVEVMVALANTAGADPHFNMPALFEDEYVASFAAYVKENLAPGLRASIEYSNEVWNWGFPQTQYMNVEGRKLWPNEGSAWVQYGGSRMQRMCKLWKETFAGQEARIRCLISPQTGWLDMVEKMLDCPAWAALHPELGKCSRWADAVSLTGYFSGCLQQKHNTAKVQAWLAQGKPFALDRFFEQLEHGKHMRCDEQYTGSLDETIQRYSDFKRIADARGLEIYVYESGTHFDYDGKDPAVAQLFVDASRDPRMGRLYRRNLEAFKQAGGTVFNAWGWIADKDMWSNSDNLGDRGHPKYRTLSEFGRGVPCWWKDCDRGQR
ncbi:MAG: hypothetical protein ABW217_07485 [Polyangiaceae bacterium]